MDQQLLDRLAIRELVENWAVWRDAGDWERFAPSGTTTGDDGDLVPGAGARSSSRVSRRGSPRASASCISSAAPLDLAGPRAIAQTKMTISQRALVHDVLCDVVCTGRFYDFLEKRAGRWGIVLRQPIYEKDRIDPVDPAAELRLDRSARRVSRRLSPSRLHAVADRLQGQARHAGPDRPRGREALGEGTIGWGKVNPRQK